MSDDQSGEPDDGSRLPDGLFRGGTEGEGMWTRPVSKFGDELTDDTLFRRSRRRAAPDDGHPEAVVNPQTGGYSPKRVDAFGPSPASDVPASDFPASDVPASDFPASDFPASWDQAFAAGAPRPDQPPEESPGGPQVGEFDRHHPFTRSLVKTLASAVIPGLGLIRSRARWLGVTLTGAVLLAVIVIGGWALSDPVAAAATAVKPSVLHPLSIVLVVVALLWVVVIVGTHLITRPAHRTRAQSIVGALVVGGLSFAIAAPMAVASRYSATQAGLVEGVFSSSDQKKSQTRPTIDTKGKAADVWAKKPRLNILLVGLDNTAARHYSDVDVSTDTMMVASIETSTGNMVITQVPRNMARVPFPTGSELSKRYPRGWYDGKNADNSNYFANAIWGHLPAEQPDLFKNTDYPGADALKYGLEGALGLKIDYFVALNIDGLMALIDAMGGVRLNVNQRIPIGGNDVRGPVGYIEPGQNKLLNGYYAMWYARARHGLDGGDFSRMGRQTCVIKGVLDQADPATMLTRYEAIAKASEKMVETDIPQDLLPALLELAVRVKNGRQARVLFVHQKDGFITYDPDYAMMRARVAAAIKAVDEQPSGTPSAVPSSVTPSGPASSATPSAPAGSTSATPAPAESLVDACAWDPTSTASPSATPRR
ncbi:LCP family protein [Aestuariimicrobium kwangyangense]|uniref:LCP family glycopolymer transferase n=1 Tax=Aestuariimicrobium kwangyangense TaxID=396389 RepID=UPI0003B5FDC3|nr:LCP family protein [Aestuariimicrobium kwangyangense]